MSDDDEINRVQHQREREIAAMTRKPASQHFPIDKTDDWERRQDESRKPAERTPESAAREYEIEMDFRNWFERTEGVPFSGIGTFHHDWIAKRVAAFAAHRCAELERERLECKQAWEKSRQFSGRLLAALENELYWLRDQIDGGDECRGRDSEISERIRKIEGVI